MPRNRRPDYTVVVEELLADGGNGFVEFAEGRNKEEWSRRPWSTPEGCRSRSPGRTRR